MAPRSNDSAVVGEAVSIVELAEELAMAEQSLQSIVPFSKRYQNLGLEDAYAIQQAGMAERISMGAEQIGHKIGLTSVAMQQQFGIDEPDWGVLLEEMRISNGGELSLQELFVPRAEAEIAFLLGRDLDGSNVDLDTAWESVSAVMLALEIIDSRMGMNGLALVDTVADNASSARVVLGSPSEIISWRSLESLEVTLAVDGAPVHTGTGQAVLGNPLKALVWLARRLSSFGGQLRAGQIVLAGAVHASIPLTSGTTVSATSPDLSPAMLKVVD